MAWAESAVIAFYTLLLALFIVLLKHKSYAAGVAFGCTASFLYTIHPRGLPILLIAVAYLILLAVLKDLPMLTALSGVISACTIFLLTRLINAHLENAGWGGKAFSNTPSAASIASQLTHFKSLLLVVLGQILYLSQATYGLFLLGIISISLRLWRRVSAVSQARIHDVTLHWYTFLFVTSLGVFLASSLKFGNLKRGDQLIYGRYNEAFLAPYLAFGLVALYSDNSPRLRVFIQTSLVVAMIAGVTLLVLVGRGYQIYGPSVAVNIFGIYPVVRDLGPLNLAMISLIAISLFLAIRFAAIKSFVLGILLLAALFASVVIYDYNAVLLQAQRALRASTTLASEIRSLGKINDISYDWSFYHPVFFNYQYLLPNIVFHKFNSGGGERPVSEAVISGNNWLHADKLAAEFVAVENDVDNALWILPGALRQEFSRRFSSITRARLGAQRIRGVRESGFHGQEWHGGIPLRWTNGVAKLVVPVDAHRPPRALRVGLESYNPKGTTLRILANGYELYHAKIPTGSWSKTFGLGKVTRGNQVNLELLSNTFVPKEVLAGSIDARTLGILVQGIWLLESDQLESGVPLTNKGYYSQLNLIERERDLIVAPGQTTPLRIAVRDMSEEP